LPSYLYDPLRSGVDSFPAWRDSIVSTLEANLNSGDTGVNGKPGGWDEATYGSWSNFQSMAAGGGLTDAQRMQLVSFVNDGGMDASAGSMGFGDRPPASEFDYVEDPATTAARILQDNWQANMDFTQAQAGVGNQLAQDQLDFQKTKWEASQEIQAQAAADTRDYQQKQLAMAQAQLAAETAIAQQRLGLEAARLAAQEAYQNAQLELDRMKLEQGAEQFQQTMELQWEQLNQTIADREQRAQQWQQEFQAAQERFEATFGLEEQRFELAKEEAAALADRFEKEFGLRREEAERMAEQFRMSFELEQDRFALEQERMEELKKQFQQEFGLKEEEAARMAEQWAAEFGLDQERLELSREEMAAMADRFEQEFGLKREEAERMASQFAQTFGLEERKVELTEEQMAAEQARWEQEFERSGEQWERQFASDQQTKELQAAAQAAAIQNERAATVAELSANPADYVQRDFYMAAQADPTGTFQNVFTGERGADMTLPELMEQQKDIQAIVPRLPEQPSGPPPVTVTTEPEVDPFEVAGAARGYDFINDSALVTGDQTRPGRTGHEEVIFNPTRAPLAIVPDQHMPGLERLPDGDWQLPGYAEGTEEYLTRQLQPDADTSYNSIIEQPSDTGGFISDGQEAEAPQLVDYGDDNLQFSLPDYQDPRLEAATWTARPVEEPYVPDDTVYRQDNWEQDYYDAYSRPWEQADPREEWLRTSGYYAQEGVRDPWAPVDPDMHVMPEILPTDPPGTGGWLLQPDGTYADSRGNPAPPEVMERINAMGTPDFGGQVETAGTEPMEADVPVPVGGDDGSGTDDGQPKTWQQMLQEMLTSAPEFGMLDYSGETLAQLPSMRFLTGQISDVEWRQFSNRPSPIPALGIEVPALNALNPQKLLMLRQQDPGAFEFMKSLWRAGNRDLDSEFQILLARGPQTFGFTPFESSTVQTV
jgi:hypothetical protein